jgi:hypothetical protein
MNSELREIGPVCDWGTLGIVPEMDIPKHCVQRIFDRGGAIRAALDSWPAESTGGFLLFAVLWQQRFTEWVGPQALPHYLALGLPLAVAIGSYHLVEKPSREILRGAFAQKNKMWKDARRHEIRVSAQSHTLEWLRRTRNRTCR